VIDVIVVGGGLAGMAASLHLARGGLRVCCFEPDRTSHHCLGESLDWAAPDLLKSLGLPTSDLIKKEMATYKKHVTVSLLNGNSKEYSPPVWLARPPFNVELRTLHVDRMQLAQELRSLATDAGVKIINQKVVALERTGEKLSGIQTEEGNRFAAPWFIDASGLKTNLFSRELSLPAHEYGPTKVAIWSYFRDQCSDTGTTLRGEAKPSEYLDWIWEIPINPDTVSVGYVTTAAMVKMKRQEGLSIQEIFRQQLAKFQRFDSLLGMAIQDSPHVVSFRCRVHKQVCGSNWIIIGDAASLPDPMAANGVTAALRQAAEAAALIIKFNAVGEVSRKARNSYNRRVVQMGRFFNSGIENILYDTAVRNRIGVLKAATVYTSAAWSMNAIYSRLKPVGATLTFGFACSLMILRSSSWAFNALSRQR
jgi:flavin-dependent dehydrogenase